MGIKTEPVGYCDRCNKQIRGDVKGIHIKGVIEFINDSSSYVKELSKLGESNTQLINDKIYVLCRGCFSSVFYMADKDSREYKDLESSHTSYLDSLYQRGGPGDR